LAVNFFEKEVKKARKRFDKVYKALSVCNLDARYSALLSVCWLGVLSADITKVKDKKMARESIGVFYRARDVLNNFLTLWKKYARKGDVRMKSFNPLVIIPCVLLGLLVGLIASRVLHEEAEKKAKASIECIAEKGVNMFGENYAIAGVVDENGRCIELLDTAQKVTKSKTVESITNEDGYTIRIEDLDGDGRVDIYNEIDNKTGQKVLNIFKDFKTGNVYSECTLPGRAILGEGPSLEDRGILDSYNDMLVLKNPEKHGYKSVSKLK
jgi:hypothetical protein